jgi:hypothetical protein
MGERVVLALLHQLQQQEMMKTHKQGERWAVAKLARWLAYIAEWSFASNAGFLLYIESTRHD